MGSLNPKVYIKKTNNIAYDCFVKQVIDDYYFLIENKDVINFINRQYVVNNFNYSTEKDAEIENESINTTY